MSTERRKSTRVNYAQNLALIHGLEALVCMATDGATGVEGGNWQIFDRMARSATSDIRLNTSITLVEKQDDGSYVLHSKSLTSGMISAETEQFDTVILAAPYQFSEIE